MSQALFSRIDDPSDRRNTAFCGAGTLDQARAIRKKDVTTLLFAVNAWTPMVPENPAEEFVRSLTEKQNRLYGYIFSLIGDHHRAADVLQETNLVLWRKSGEFRSGSDFIPWAFAIARFQVLAHLRDNRRDRLLLDPELVELVSVELEEESGYFEEMQAALRVCLTKLPGKSRHMIDSRYFGGQSIKQIAGELEKTDDAVKVALLRIRKGLRDCVQRQLKQSL